MSTINTIMSIRPIEAKGTALMCESEKWILGSDQSLGFDLQDLPDVVRRRRKWVLSGHYHPLLITLSIGGETHQALRRFLAPRQSITISAAYLREPVRALMDSP
ncbi:MAG: hypothetical protein LZF62_140091 [Nitrospira sp.]|nr:MAG: hypothetical protein LZF62_140091 [Nitrospira sp.]